MQMKYKAYIYPITARLRTGISNPYLDHFMEAAGGYIKFLNKTQPSKTGIFNLSKYIFRIDYLFLNWVENLPEKKGGYVQSIFLMLLLHVKKLFGVKIIWTLHNKISHSSRHLKFKKLLFKELIRKSDLIITHSREGEYFARELEPGIKNRIFYFPHPVVPVEQIKPNGGLEYDILIWGSLAPYKGIDRFLEFLESRQLLKKYRILIAGKAVSEEFFEKINRYSSSEITLINDFVSSEDLARLIGISRIVLFTYSGSSVLSSGALMDSIAYQAQVVGPRLGAFAELGQMGIIHTYNDFQELLEVLDDPEIFQGIPLQNIYAFIHSHTWQDFSRALQNQLPLDTPDGQLEMPSR